MDDFEELKERVRGLKFDVPSAKGCLSRLAEDGIEGAMAEAAVEAVFHEAKEEFRKRREEEDEPEDPRSRSQRKRSSNVGMAVKNFGLFAVSVMIGTVIWRVAFSSAGLLSVVHILCIGGTLITLKVGQQVLS